MMVPVQEFKQLQNYYKGQITESALLNKAGRLAAEQHLILKDKRIPDSLAVKMTKPMALEQARLVKRVRTGSAGPTVYQNTEEPEGMADGPIESMLRQIIKGVKKEPTSPVRIKQEPATPSTSGIKKETLTTSKIPRPKKPSTSKIPRPKKPISKAPTTTQAPKPSRKSKGVFRQSLEGALDGALKSLSKGKRPKRKTEVEKLQPASGWEDWDPQGSLRGPLRYDTDDEEESD